MTDTVEQPTLDEAASASDDTQLNTSDDARAAVPFRGRGAQPPTQTLAVPETAQQALAADTAAGVPPLWSAAMRLVTRIHDTEFVPKAMRGRPATVLACILYGDELGIGPMQSLQSIHVIEGKPAAAPELMRALVLRAGHTFKVIEKSNSKVTVYGKRRDDDSESTVTFTIDDAVTAELCTLKDGKPYARSSTGKRLSWEKYPRALLMARATSELCRDIFSDVIAGLSYTPEEAASIDGGTWTPEQVDDTTGEIIEA